MHPKNSTTPTIVQEAPLTAATTFFQLSMGNSESSLFQVRGSKSASEALNLSSMLLHSVVELMGRLTEYGMSTNEIYAVRFLVDSSAALMDASTRSIEFGNRHGGAQ